MRTKSGRAFVVVLALAPMQSLTLWHGRGVRTAFGLGPDAANERVG